MAKPWLPDVPYDELPPPPSAEVLETRRVLKAAIEARAALARLDAAAAALPNQAVLINSIPLLEAQASSEIENVVTTTDALFRHAQDEVNADPATKEALRYRTALREGFEEVRTRGLSASAAARICTAIKGHSMEVRAVPGTRIAGAASGSVAYSPP